jgi:hypothetical protein
MLARMDCFLEKMDPNFREMKAEIRANNEKFEALKDTIVSRTDAHHARTEANQEMTAKLDANHKRMRASVNAWREETTAYQEATEGYPEKMDANPEETKSVASQEEAPKEDAAVETGRALNKRHKGRHLAVLRRGKAKERTQGSGGSRKKLATGSRRMTRRAGMARCKGHGRKRQNKDYIARGTQKGRTYEKRC